MLLSVSIEAKTFFPAGSDRLAGIAQYKKCNRCTLHSINERIHGVELEWFLDCLFLQTLLSFAKRGHNNTAYGTERAVVRLLLREKSFRALRRGRPPSRSSITPKNNSCFPQAPVPTELKLQI